MTDKQMEHIKILNTSRRKKDGWKCKHCYKIFETRAILNQHMHENHSEFCGKSKLKENGWKCSYCEKDFRTRKELFLHLKICESRLKMPLDKNGRVKSILKSTGNFCCEFCKKIYTTNYGYLGHIKRCDLNPQKEIDFWWKGKHHKSETRAKIALKTIERIEKTNGNFHCNYNKIACEFIDSLNKEKSWNLQHALNGGEFKVGPYSLDGYDVNLKIAFEYDEPYHESPDQKEKDKLREEYIIKSLSLKEFWRYSEKYKKLYRVF